MSTTAQQSPATSVKISTEAFENGSALAKLIRSANKTGAAIETVLESAILQTGYLLEDVFPDILNSSDELTPAAQELSQCVDCGSNRIAFEYDRRNGHITGASLD